MCRAIVILILGFVVASCAITPKLQKLREDASQPAKTTSRDWNGEAITIENEGLSPDPGESGIEINVSRTATRVSIEAVFAAWSDNDLQHHGEHAIQDVVASFTVDENARGIDITCRHGQTYGTARAVGSGCRRLRITIPIGATDRPHALTIVSGVGSVVFTGDAPSWVHDVIVDSRSQGAIDVSLRPVEGAVIRLVGYGKMKASLPSDFSAKRVSFGLSDPEKVDPSAGVVVTDFPGMVDGAAYPADGPKPHAADTLLMASAGRLEPELVQVRRLIDELE